MSCHSIPFHSIPLLHIVTLRLDSAIGHTGHGSPSRSVSHGQCQSVTVNQAKMNMESVRQSSSIIIHQRLIARSTTLRNSSKMTKTFQAILEMLLGETCSNVKAPSGPTMSRARPKVDAALMLMRRSYWEKNSSQRSIQLGHLDCGWTT